MKALYRLLYYLSILLTSILAGFTLAGAFAGDASPEGFKLMPFIGLVLPILLLANVHSRRELTNDLRSLQTVEIRHFDIHQNKVRLRFIV